MPRNALLILALLLDSAHVAAESPNEIAAARRTRVIIVGVDGLGAESIGRAECPNLRALMSRGAWTLKARGVMPTLSSPNWASVLTGAGPEQHGITSNGWFKRMAQFRPTCGGSGGLFPTIFAWLREQRPSATSAVFHDWDGFARLVEPGIPDVIEHVRGAAPTMSRALQYWQTRQPDLMFIHLDLVDHAGHTRGWNSRAYLHAVHAADLLIGQLVSTVENKDALDHTLILVTSDHGGSGHVHGRNSMAEIEIPWIIAGPGVPAGVEITVPVSTTDTAPTAARVLGIHPPDCAVGRNVASAFADSNLRQARRASISAAPQLFPPAEAIPSAAGR